MQVEGVEWIKAHFAVKMDGYDVIRGYRADDSYFGFVRSFLENGITLGQLTRAMRFGDLGKQVMLKSKKAFARLKFEGCAIAPWSVYHAQRVNRDESARNEFRKETATRPSDGIYMIDILRNGMERGDERLR